MELLYWPCSSMRVHVCVDSAAVQCSAVQCVCVCVDSAAVQCRAVQCSACVLTACSHSQSDHVGAGERRERPEGRGEGSTCRGGTTDPAGDALPGSTDATSTCLL